MKGLLVISLWIFLNPHFCGSKQKWQKDVKEDGQDVQADVYSSVVTLKRKKMPQNQGNILCAPESSLNIKFKPVYWITWYIEKGKKKSVS